jgi:hypothetical protein
LWEIPFTEGLRILDYYVWAGDSTRSGKALRWADDVIDLEDPI